MVGDMHKELMNEPLFHGELEYMTTLKEASKYALNRVFQNLEFHSYVVISSDRHELSKDENLKRFEKMKEIVRVAKFSYKPLKGGYLENVPDGVDIEDAKARRKYQLYENSLIIFPSHPTYCGPGHYKSDKELFDFGLRLCQFDSVQQNDEGKFIGDDPTDVESFGQDSFLYKDDSSVAYYTKDGAKDFEVGDNYLINDGFQQYFTHLAYSAVKDVNKFIFTETFIPSEPLGYSGRVVRAYKGELF